MKKFLVFIPFYRVVVEDTLTGVLIFRSECLFRRLRYRLVVRIDIRQFIHLEYLVTPEDGIERKLHGVRIGVAVIGVEVIDRRIRYGFILHKVAVDDTGATLCRYGETSSEALAGIGVRDLLVS